MSRPPEARVDRRGTLIVLLPYLVMAGVTFVDLVAGPEYGFLPLLSLAPAFASLVGPVRRTALVGVASLVLSLVLAVYDDLIGTRQNTLTLATLIGVLGAGVLASAFRQRRERELANAWRIAEVAQRVLLRPVPRTAGHVRVAVSYTSAVAEARIGGDLYEVTSGPAGVRAIVGDVQGKGLAAVETAAVVVGAFREAGPDEPGLETVGLRLERALERDLSSEQFVTAILAEIGDDGTITLLNYGHPPPMIVRADGETLFVESNDPVPPLGIGLGEPASPIPEKIPFGSGDQILLYTDGVIEARDPAGSFYPLRERASILLEHDPESALDNLRQDILDHVSRPLQDDTAMLLLRRR